MRREERFMNILGGLDEKYVALAMPSSCGHSTIGDTGNVVYAQPSEDNTEVSKKDLRIYWITRALGMAAALALVVGGGVWLWKNWDKIAVSGNDRPGEVTTVSDTAITSSSYEITGHEVTPRMEAAWKITNDYMYGLLFTISGDEVKDIMRASCGAEPNSETSFEVPEGAEKATLYIYDNMPFFSYNAEMGMVVSDSQGLTQVDYTIEAKSENDANTVYDDIKDKLTDMLGQPDSYDDTYCSWDVMETGICFDLRKQTNNQVKFFMYNKYISNADDKILFEQITDTSMPDPGIDSMYGTYLDFSSPWKVRVSHILLGMYTEQGEKGLEWVKSKESVPTPYNLYDSMSLVSFCRDLNIPWESIEDNVRAWDGSVRYPAGTPREEYEDIERFTEEELAALKNGDDETIVKLLASDYSIVVGENVFSPMWLYYHTAEDYKAAGIDPYAMHSLLEKYADLGLTEEAWRAFRKKLILYAYSEMYPEKDRTYTYELDVSEPLGDEAFRIFEDVFYGQWEYAGNIDGHFETFNMTYNGSSFRFGRILGIFETDEIYVIHYSSSGGTLECYVIEKSSPDIMYETDVLTSLGGIEEIKLGDNERVKYINRRAATAELKPGELSIPGLTYLFHIYGSDFEDYYRAIMDRDSYQSISEDEGLYLGNGYVLDNFIQYLADMSENSVTFALPYVHDKQESHQTAVYYELTFTKNESGEWSVEYSKSEAEINTANLTSDEDGELPDYLKYNNLLYRFEKYIDITKIELNNYQLLGQVNEDVFDLPQNDLSSNFLRPGVELYCYSGNEILAVLYYEYVYNDVTRSHDLKILEEPKGILLMEENVYLELYRQ